MPLYGLVFEARIGEATLRGVVTRRSCMSLATSRESHPAGALLHCRHTGPKLGASASASAGRRPGAEAVSPLDPAAD
jgi:hypothetical protein